MHVVGEQAHSRAVPIDQFHAVGPFRPEHIDGARERIGLHRLAHQCRQTLGALAVMQRSINQLINIPTLSGISERRFLEE